MREKKEWKCREWNSEVGICTSTKKKQVYVQGGMIEEKWFRGIDRKCGG